MVGKAWNGVTQCTLKVKLVGLATYVCGDELKRFWLAMRMTMETGLHNKKWLRPYNHTTLVNIRPEYMVVRL